MARKIPVEFTLTQWHSVMNLLEDFAYHMGEEARNARGMPEAERANRERAQNAERAAEMIRRQVEENS